MDNAQEKKQAHLAEIYETHHRRGGRCEFTFGGEEKGRRFAAWVGADRRVLDLGCRDGTLTRFYAAGNEVIGVDIDRAALAQCKRELGIQTRWADVTTGLPFEDESFDVVVASELLEHVGWPEVVVREVARVLRPGGIFVGSVPNAFRLKNRLLFLLGIEYEHDPTHLRRFSWRGLSDLLRQYLTDVHIVPAFGRMAWLHGRLFANTLLWRAHKP